MIDPTVFSDAAAWLAPDRAHCWGGEGQRGMCAAIVQALDTMEFGTCAPYLDLLAEYFKPETCLVFWWPCLDETTQQERFMALHFMALIAEDLE